MRAIRTVPDPILRQQAKPVHRYNAVLRRLVDEMFTICEQSGGVGLAAPQIGISSEIIVVDYHMDHLALCNPYPVAHSGSETLPEGCLSIPGVAVDVARATHLTVSYRDVWGEEQTIYAQGTLARILQHEMDHLEGILITDYEQTLDTLAGEVAANGCGWPVQPRDSRDAALVH